MTILLPGIIALTGMSGAIAGGLGWLTARTSGIAREYIAAPIGRLSILGALIGAALLVAFIVGFSGIGLAFASMTNGLRATWFDSGVDTISLWISAAVLAGFAVIGMLFALNAFLKWIRK